MSNKNMPKALFPFMPNWGWDEEKVKEQWNGFEAGMEKLWDQKQAMYKDARNASKEQWDHFFSQCMEMEQTFVDMLPDEAISLPGLPACPVSPKEFVEKAKELKEKANDEAVERVDHMYERRVERSKLAKKMVSESVENIKKKSEEAQASDK